MTTNTDYLESSPQTLKKYITFSYTPPKFGPCPVSAVPPIFYIIIHGTYESWLLFFLYVSQPRLLLGHLNAI
jgi:hypothetical protein